MPPRLRGLLLLSLPAVLCLGLVVGACGGDDDDDAGGAARAETAADDGAGDDGGLPDIAGSLSDDQLLVPRAYLQGVWCDSAGQTLTVEGDMARLEDGSGGVAEFPVDLVFNAGPGVSVASQTDDAFVVVSDGEETTFTRGAC